MVDYASDEEQVEAIKRWWQENGRSVITGVIVGVAAIGAWRGWDWWTTEQSLQASQYYERTMGALGAGERETVTEHAMTLRQDYAGTPYAALAAFAAARAAVDAGEPAAAEPWLRWAMENAESADLRHLARARLARVIAATGDVEGALEVIDAEVPSSFTALYSEIRGDLLVAQGDTQAAAEAYRQALDADVPPADRGLLQRKLNQVGDGKTSSTETAQQS